MEKYCRTDIAVETVPDRSYLPPGVTLHSELTDSGITVERLRISDSAVEVTGKPAGCYTTFDCGKLWELDDVPFSALADDIAAELKSVAERLVKKPLSGGFGVHIAGLGNGFMTPDALGPGTVSRLNVTRHLAKADPELFAKLGCCCLSATAPGVLGQTGIETVRLVRGAVESTHPDIVIAVDALAARSCDRLATTVQISDTGISPGSGIGNRRDALDRESLGVPVIALGAPTVVDSSTLVYDALGKAGINDIPPGLDRVLETGRSYFVAPKECDIIVKSLSRLFACAINTAFGINLEDNS